MHVHLSLLLHFIFQVWSIMGQSWQTVLGQGPLPGPEVDCMAVYRKTTESYLLPANSIPLVAAHQLSICASAMRQHTPHVALEMTAAAHATGVEGGWCVHPASTSMAAAVWWGHSVISCEEGCLTTWMLYCCVDDHGMSLFTSLGCRNPKRVFCGLFIGRGLGQ